MALNRSENIHIKETQFSYLYSNASSRKAHNSEYNVPQPLEA